MFGLRKPSKYRPLLSIRPERLWIYEKVIQAILLIDLDFFNTDPRIRRRSRHELLRPHVRPMAWFVRKRLAHYWR